MSHYFYGPKLPAEHKRANELESFLCVAEHALRRAQGRLMEAERQVREGQNQIIMARELLAKPLEEDDG
jgi:hypothetical protein